MEMWKILVLIFCKTVVCDCLLYFYCIINLYKVKFVRVWMLVPSISMHWIKQECTFFKIRQGTMRWHIFSSLVHLVNILFHWSWALFFSCLREEQIIESACWMAMLMMIMVLFLLVAGLFRIAVLLLPELRSSNHTTTSIQYLARWAKHKDRTVKTKSKVWCVWKCVYWKYCKWFAI